jgi:L-ribulose-5-phosphate 3-epimerase
MNNLTRREFAGAALAGVALAQSSGSRFIKSICRGVLPKAMTLEECFRLAKNAGFDAIELPMTGELDPSVTADEVKQVGDKARKAGMGVAALWASALGSSPLNSPDPDVRARGIEAIRKSVEFAGYLDCRTLLLVPGRVGSGAKFLVGYETTWRRISAELKKAVPLAEEAGVTMTIENVSNRFLVSPLEMRDFVDQFRSPRVQVFFDIGNVLGFGYPQDWILTLGPRIKGLHAKNRWASPRAGRTRVSGLLEGDVDWKAVMSALVKVGYRGFISPEIGHDPDDPGQLKRLSGELDQILAMA